MACKARGGLPLAPEPRGPLSSPRAAGMLPGCHWGSFPQAGMRDDRKNVQTRLRELAQNPQTTELQNTDPTVPGLHRTQETYQLAQ